MVQSVAAEDYRILGCSLGIHSAIDVHGSIVMKHETCAWKQGEAGVGSHVERVIDEIRLVGQQGRVLVDNHSVHHISIYGTCREYHFLSVSAFQLEV